MSRRILIVDDDPGMRRLLANLLVRDYAVREAKSGEEALEIAAAWCPDLVFLDLVMCGMDGHETCRKIKSLSLSRPPQVIIISASSLAEDMQLAFEAGADDYFVKPIRSCEVLSRTQLHLRLRDAVSPGEPESEPTAHTLAESVTAAADDVQATQDIAVFAMTKLAETRDNETGAHLHRLRDYTMQLARQVQQLPQHRSMVDDQFLADIYRSSPLHDIGKVGVPDKILLKPGRLTAHEFDVMKRHTAIGAGILEQAARQGNAGTFLRMAAQIARSHHERWDGSGYPDGLSGEQIPLPARIVAVADVFDALTSERQYKPAWSVERACAYIVERSGTHFDPDVASSFGLCFPTIEKVYRRYNPVDDIISAQMLPRLSVIAASK